MLIISELHESNTSTETLFFKYGYFCKKVVWVHVFLNLRFETLGTEYDW